VHINNPANKKIAKSVSLKASNQSFVGCAGELLEDIRRGKIIFRLTIGPLDTVLILEVVVHVMRGAIDRHYLPIVGALPALLRRVAREKAKLAAMIPYPGRCRSCTPIGCTVDSEVGFTVDYHDLIDRRYLRLFRTSRMG
jgi:hypothetical protein